MRQGGYVKLDGDIGYLLLKMPQEILNEVKISVDEIQNNFTQAVPANSKLAGQINKEYEIKMANKTTQYVRWAVDQYQEHNPYYLPDYRRLFSPPQLSLVGGEETWVNFQEKYEYNPIHSHSGVFSYVIWYQIPFYREDEIKYGAGKGKQPDINQNGGFEFIYYSGGNITNHPVGIDKTMEGYMALFPSHLNHIVYPFYTSDDYRITISGNIYLQGR